MQALDPVDLARLTLKDAVKDVITFRGELTLVLDPARIVDAALFFRDTEGLEYNFLSDITGVDYFPRSPRFAVCYHLYSMLYNRRLRLKVFPDDEKPEVPSVTPVYPAADWEEREAYDMFGIVFTGHPALRRIMMPEEWSGYPCRKDYPLGYEQVQFTFNFDDVMRTKPHPTE